MMLDIIMVLVAFLAGAVISKIYWNEVETDVTTTVENALNKVHNLITVKEHYITLLASNLDATVVGNVKDAIAKVEAQIQDGLDEVNMVKKKALTEYQKLVNDVKKAV